MLAFSSRFETQCTRKWSLVCSTLDDWKCLATRMRNSDVRCEQRLYRCLLEDFLPQMPKLFEFKVSMTPLKSEALFILKLVFASIYS